MENIHHGKKQSLYVHARVHKWDLHILVCVCVYARLEFVWCGSGREVISLSCVHSPSAPCCLDEVPWFIENFVFKNSSVESTPSRPRDRWRDGFGFAPFQSLWASV